MKTYYTIYKTTNKIDGKYYIGKHQTSNIDDSYLGSGKALVKAIKKYGRNNFYKEVLFVFDNELDMNNKEKEIVDEDFVNSRNTYNLTIGGEGGPIFKGKHHSEKAKDKLRQHHKIVDLNDEQKKLKYSNSKNTRLAKYGKWNTDNQRKIAREMHIGKAPKNKGKVCVNKDNHNKYISIDDLDNYLKEGWIKGNINKK